MAESTSIVRLVLGNDLESAHIFAHLQWSEGDANILAITDEKSIKIEHIRSLQALLVGSGGGKRILIWPAEKITLAAQQSLLKLIEEPPRGVEIVLAARSRSAVLPTLRSRLAAENMTSRPERGEALTLWQQLAQAETRRERLRILQALPTKRDDCVAVLTQELARPISAVAEVPWRENALTAISALKQNVTPALCVVALLTEKSLLQERA